MSALATRGKRKTSEPAWEVAQLYPNQGHWSEAEYLALPGGRLVEFDSGHIEVLPMPTTLHQMILIALLHLLDDFVEARQLGTVLVAGTPIRLWAGKFREPDVVFMRTEHSKQVETDCWNGADLVMEVVSDDRESRKRDLVTKPEEYARAKISEYWIVDPQEGLITVLRLKAKKYIVHGKFEPGDRATSALLPEFSVDVRAVLAGKRK
jgi:Uma2 family endonuclease